MIRRKLSNASSSLKSLWDEGTKRPTSCFLVIASAIALVSTIALAAGPLDHLVTDLTGVSILTALGTNSEVGVIKQFIIRSWILCGAGITVIAYLFFVRRPGRRIRTGILIATALAIVAQLTLLDHIAIARIEQLQIVNLPSVEYDRIFAKRHLGVPSIATDEDFYQASHARYLANRNELRSAWGIHDERRLQAIFFMNVVSHLWGFGNAQNVDRVGCVRENERTGFQQASALTIQDYLSSDIACCDDYAYLLKILLDGAGIPNHRVAVSGHVFNEAHLNDGWVTLDATTNILCEGTWESIQARKGQQRNSVRMTIFPHQNLVARDNAFYRDTIGHFRLRWILLAIDKNVRPIDYPDGRVIANP